MLTIRPCHRAKKPALRTHINPARWSDRPDCQYDRAQRSGDRVERGLWNHLLGIGFDALIITGEAANRLIGNLNAGLHLVPLLLETFERSDADLFEGLATSRIVNRLTTNKT